MVRVLSKILGTKSFYVVVVVVQRAAKKFTKTYNAREVRNCFGGVVAAVALVVCLRSLIFYKALFFELFRGLCHHLPSTVKSNESLVPPNNTEVS